MTHRNFANQNLPLFAIAELREAASERTVIRGIVMRRAALDAASECPAHSGLWLIRPTRCQSSPWSFRSPIFDQKSSISGSGLTKAYGSFRAPTCLRSRFPVSLSNRSTQTPSITYARRYFRAYCDEPRMERAKLQSQQSAPPRGPAAPEATGLLACWCLHQHLEVRQGRQRGTLPTCMARTDKPNEPASLPDSRRPCFLR